MTGNNPFNDIVQKVLDALPEGVKNAPKEMQKNVRDAVTSAVTKLDLVTREEFDVQKKVLTRTREKLTALEAQVNALEQQQS